MAESLQRIDVKLSPAPDQRIPLMKSRGGRRRGDTWVVSVFVIIQIGVFIATMLVNDCWTNSHGDCLLQTLGRLSFQPLTENPLLGPSQSKSVSSIPCLNQTNLLISLLIGNLISFFGLGFTITKSIIIIIIIIVDLALKLD